MFNLNDLNEKQQEAVTSTEGYVRVIAGAGSGKTKLLVYRFAYLVQECGIDPNNILCVTFTNKAAREMKNRIKNLLGSQIDASLICTYHSFCCKVIKKEYQKLFLPKNFQIIDTYEQKQILADIYQKYELKFNHASFEQILRIIAKYKREKDYVEKLINADNIQILEKIETMNDQILEDYLQKQKLISALDFDDLVFYTIYLFTNYSKVQLQWKNQLQYIMVDEFQDSSKIEMMLIDLLSSIYHNVLIVGDPDQNIYEWRGSDIKLLVDFDKKYIPTKTIILERNYRSTPQILKCANFLIRNNELRLEKNLYTKNPELEEVNHFHFKCEEEQNNIIAREIRRLKEQYNYNYADIAVLYRSSFLSRTIEKGLVNNNIPYIIYGGVKFFQRMEVLDCLAYLKLLCFNDDLSFKRIINVPRRKIGRGKIDYLLDIQNKENKLLYDILKEHVNDDIFKNTDALTFINLIEGLRKDLEIKTVFDIVSDAITKSGYDKYLKELGDEERLDNITEFKRISADFLKNSEGQTLIDFLNNVAIQSSEDVDTNNSYVQLSTIHASKGLEYKAVFLVGLSEGIFPSSRTLEERNLLGLEEERRLCYVAITRAKEKLYLMDCEGISLNGMVNLPSRFLEEINPINYLRFGQISKSLVKKAKTYISFHLPGNTVLKQVNDEVNHHVFGKGKITAVNEKKHTYEITFERFTLPRTISMDYFLPKEQIDILDNDIIDSEIIEYPDEEPLFDEEEIIDCDFELDEEDSDQSINEIELPIIYDNFEDNLSTAIEDKNEIMEEKTPKYIENNHEYQNYGNLWNDPNVPKSGWDCELVYDLGKPSGTCEMCGKESIRYSHKLRHHDYHDLYVGCICAGKLTGDMEGAKKRERDVKNSELRKQSFINKPWKTSFKGNEYKEIKYDLIVIIYNNTNNLYTYSINSKYCGKWYQTKEEIKALIFEKYQL